MNGWNKFRYRNSRRKTIRQECSLLRNERDTIQGYDRRHHKTRKYDTTQHGDYIRTQYKNMTIVGHQYNIRYEMTPQYDDTIGTKPRKEKDMTRGCNTRHDTTTSNMIQDG